MSFTFVGWKVEYCPGGGVEEGDEEVDKATHFECWLEKVWSKNGENGKWKITMH